MTKQSMLNHASFVNAPDALIASSPLRSSSPASLSAAGERALTRRQAAALALRKQDFTLDRIAEFLKTDLRAVRRLLSRAQRRGVVVPRPGKPTKTPIPSKAGRMRLLPFSQLNARDRIRIANL